jgi:hypothetical protein
MANLSGQTIQSTYPGLLNLNTATTGVTSTPQAITDGLGNNTGALIGTNFLTAPNIFPMLGSNLFVPDYMGPGFASTGVAPVANQQNKINAFLFYDTGKYAYSAITYGALSATTTGDVVECAFYTCQYYNGVGVVPYQLIQSGITLTTNTVQQFLNTTLPSTLSFSGYGGGYFYFLMKITNSGATPTVRLSSNPQNTNQFPSIIGLQLGMVKNRSVNATVNAIGTNASVPAYVLNTATTFNATYALTDVDINTSVTAYNMGFNLRCIK